MARHALFFRYLLFAIAFPVLGSNVAHAQYSIYSPDPEIERAGFEILQAHYLDSSAIDTTRTLAALVDRLDPFSYYIFQGGGRNNWMYWHHKVWSFGIWIRPVDGVERIISIQQGSPALDI